MKSITLTKVLETNSFPKIEGSSYLRYYYQQQCDELNNRRIEAIKLEDFLSDIRNSDDFETFRECLDSLKREFLYSSETHGVLHNERVALFSFYLSSKLKLSARDVRLALYAACYHDIGRRNDWEDDCHGLASAEKLDSLQLDVTDEELNILKTIITCHSLPDERFDAIAQANKIQDWTRTRTLFAILKDSDALDRVRLGYPYIILELLRNDLTLHMIPLAYELMNFYNSSDF